MEANEMDNVFFKQNHHSDTKLQIPPDVCPALLRSPIEFPKNGTILLEWDKDRKQVQITVWNQDKPKENNKSVCTVCGRDYFRRAKLHFRRGILIKICR